MLPRVLVLASAHTYRLDAFLEAAGKMGVEVVRGVDAPPAHTGRRRHPSKNTLRLDFCDPDRAVTVVQRYALEYPVRAVIGTDDATVTLAAKLSEEIDLPHNALEAAEASRNKLHMRRLFQQAGVPSPWFQSFPLTADPTTIAHHISFPCVIKPLTLSGSRGVMRVDDEAQLGGALARLKTMLAKTDATEFLVEGFIPGVEVALEGLLTNGQLQVLALFDKPDPLDGPFFEETIYVTPSRLPPATQQAIAHHAQQAALALGLREGPVHAELRINADGVWLVEVAGRSIGGLCSRVLRFSAEMSLEELILRHALGQAVAEAQREEQAGGVLMIPIPRAGILTAVEGQAAALAVPGIESLEITARLNYPITPLPEGDSYLGFMFARAQTPAEVEAALRTAHEKLRIHITEPLIVIE